jgi:hypothetical protein
MLSLLRLIQGELSADVEVGAGSSSAVRWLDGACLFLALAVALGAAFEGLSLVEPALAEHLQNLGLGLEQSAGIADAEVEELVDEGVGLRGGLLGAHVVVVQEEGIVALLEQDELRKEALLEEVVVCVQTLQHLHALVRHACPARTVLPVQSDQHFGHCQVVVAQLAQQLRYLGQFLSGGLSSNQVGEFVEFLLADAEAFCEFEVGRVALVGGLDLLGDD